MLERKSIPFEIKEDDIADGQFTGYGSVFGNADLYGDIVVKGAFARSLREHKKSGTAVQMLWAHNTDEPIGEWSSIEEDDRGLKMTGRLWIDEPYRVDRSVMAYRAITAPGAYGLSIGFRTRKREIDEENDIRKLLEIDLYEVSLTGIPANQAARVLEAKSAAMTLRDFERFLRDQGGFSRREAELIAKEGFRPSARDERETAAAIADPRDEDATKAVIAQLQAMADRYKSQPRN